MAVTHTRHSPSGADEPGGRGNDDKEKAYDAFYLETIAPLARKARMIGCPPQRAEEIAREVLVKLWQQWDKLATWTADERAAYAIRSVCNAVIDMYRSDGRRRETPVEDIEITVRNSAGVSDVERTAVNRDEAEHIFAFIEKTMSARERQVILLTADGYSAAEIADILCIDPGTVRSHLHRARRLLHSYREGGSS